MPIGLILTTPSGVVPNTPEIAAACAAARSCIRTRGYTIRECWSAALQVRRRRAALRAGRGLPPGGAPPEWLAPRASAWFAAESVARCVGWPGAKPPSPTALAVGVWPTGSRSAASRLPSRHFVPG